MRKQSIVKFGALVAVVLAALAAGVTVALRSVNLETVKEVLTTQVRTATGRSLTIAGPLELHPGLIPRVVAGGVTLSNPPGSSRPDMVRIKRLELEVALLPLLQRKIQVNRLIISSPDILIETGQGGAGNLDFGKSAAAEAKPAAPAGGPGYQLNLVEVKIENGRVTWQGIGQTEAVEIQELAVQPDRAAAGRLSYRLRAKARGQVIEVTGTTGRLDAAWEGKAWPLDLKVGVEGLALTVKGSLAEPTALRGLDLALAAQGKELSDAITLAGMTRPEGWPLLGPFTVSARLSDAGGVLALTDVTATMGRREVLLINAKGAVRDLQGAAAVDLALDMEGVDLAGLSPLAGTALPARGPVKIAGVLSGGGKAWRFAGINAVVSGSVLTGDLAVDVAGRPHLSGRLSCNALNGDDFTAPAMQPGDRPASRPGKAQRGDDRIFSDQPVPVEGLRSLDAELALQVGRLVLSEYQLTDIAVDLRLNNGRLALKPFRFDVAGGKVEGEADLDAAGEGFAAALRLHARQVELGRLLPRGTLSGGKSDLKVDMRGRGHSVRSLMASLNGETVLTVGDGKIQNKAITWAAGDIVNELVSSLNPLAKNEDTTRLTCAVARFVVHDGIATVDKGIAVRTDKVDVVGSGIVDLRTENLDLGIRPHAREGIGLSLSGPLAGLTRLRGTFANPSLALDTEGTLRSAATMGAAAATGGLSLLGQLVVDKATAGADPCRTALGQAPASPQKGRSQKQRSGNVFQNLFGH